MTCCEMCLSLTKQQTGAQLRIAHERAQYAQKGTHELLLPATAPQYYIQSCLASKVNDTRKYYKIPPSDGTDTEAGGFPGIQTATHSVRGNARGRPPPSLL